MCGLRSSGLLGLQMAQISWTYLCLPLLPASSHHHFQVLLKYWQTHTHSLHTLFLSLTLILKHTDLTRRLLIYVPEHFQIFVFQVLNVCSSYRCFQIILILIAKAARRDRIFFKVCFSFIFSHSKTSRCGFFQL